MTVKVVVRFPTGFSDHNILPRPVHMGNTEEVTEDQYRLMMEAGYNVELVEKRLSVNKEVHKQARLQAAASNPETDWQPIGWYKAQLAKGAK